MRNCFCAMVVGLSALLGVNPASACFMFAEFKPDDIKYADVVVIGRIMKYGIVQNQEIRKDPKERLWYSADKLSPRWMEEYKQKLERSADKLSPQWMKEYKQITPKGVHRRLGDYARLTVQVDEILVGKPKRTITATWINSTFSLPEEMKKGTYLIGLIEPDSQRPPLRGPSATVLPSPEQKMMSVLQAPCAGAFILDTSRAREVVKTIRDVLAKPPSAREVNEKK